MIERVSLLDAPPAVGRPYGVPCVLGMFPARWRKLHPLLARNRWWPFRGKPHDDPDFGVYSLHVHIDARFVQDDEWEALWRVYESRERELTRAPAVRAEAPYMLPAPYPGQGYALLERTCLRLDARIDDKWNEASTGDLLSSHPEREKWRLGKRRICAHHGYDLRTAVPDADGCVQCPLHFLKYCADGKLVISERAQKRIDVNRALDFLGTL